MADLKKLLMDLEAAIPDLQALAGDDMGGEEDGGLPPLPDEEGLPPMDDEGGELPPMEEEPGAGDDFSLPPMPPKKKLAKKNPFV